MDGLRSFIEMDNHSALEVGHMHNDLRPLKVQRPKFSEDCSEVLREGADDLTPRAEEVDTLEACIGVDQIEEKQMETTAGGRRLPRFLPSSLRRNWSNRMGRAVFSLQRDEQGSRSQEAE